MLKLKTFFNPKKIGAAFFHTSKMNFNNKILNAYQTCITSLEEATNSFTTKNDMGKTPLLLNRAYKEFEIAQAEHPNEEAIKSFLKTFQDTYVKFYEKKLDKIQENIRNTSAEDYQKIYKSLKQNLYSLQDRGQYFVTPEQYAKLKENFSSAFANLGLALLSSSVDNKDEQSQKCFNKANLLFPEGRSKLNYRTEELKQSYEHHHTINS